MSCEAEAVDGWRVLECIHQNSPCSEDTLWRVLNSGYPGIPGISRCVKDFLAKGFLVQVGNAPAKYKLTDRLPTYLQKFFDGNGQGTLVAVREAIQQVYGWPCSKVQVEAGLEKLRRNGQLVLKAGIYAKPSKLEPERKGQLKNAAQEFFSSNSTRVTLDHLLEFNKVAVGVGVAAGVRDERASQEDRLMMAEILDELTEAGLIEIVRKRDYNTGDAQLSPPDLYQRKMSELERRTWRENEIAILQTWVAAYIEIHSTEVICMSHLFQALRDTGARQGHCLKQALDRMLHAGVLVKDRNVSYRLPKRSGGSRFESRLRLGQLPQDVDEEDLDEEPEEELGEDPDEDPDEEPDEEPGEEPGEEPDEGEGLSG